MTLPLFGGGRLLNRSQRVQRCLLCLGHAPGSRNIEPLVGPVSPQHTQVLAAFHVPDVDRAIVSTTGERAPIWTHLERLNGPLVRPSPQDTHVSLEVPPTQHA